MSLSRTARILIALLLVAAAAFFWVNFLNQPETPTPVSAQSSTPSAQPGVPTPSPATSEAGEAAAPGAAGQAPAGTEDAAAAGAAEGGAAGASGATVTTTPGAAPGVVTAPAVVTPPTVVLRDLVVDDLPFLVTSPPVAETPEAEAEGTGATRPQGSRRGSINPFSPVVVQAPPAPPAQPVAAAPAEPGSLAAAPSEEPTVVVVNSDGTPQAGATTAEAGTSPTTAPGATTAKPGQAPAPRALAPAPTRASDLPRPLPIGTLPITPDILRDARTAPTTPSGPANLADVAAVRLPPDSAPSALPASGSEASTTVAPTGVDVLGPGQPTAESVSKPSAPTLPLVVGADALSRYLRDNDVRFTGTALGPLSVGVFRSKQFDQPVVLTLGQSLPETEIVLADLRGYEAKFSLGDNTQVLSLDIRR